MAKPYHPGLAALLLLPLGLFAAAPPPAFERGLVGWWRLRGHCKDHSGRGHHGKNHNVDLSTGQFKGRDAYIEVPDAPALRFGTREFSISAGVFTRKELDDVLGDVLSKYDPVWRKGVNLSLGASAGGYNSAGNARHVHFGVDDGRPGGGWTAGGPAARPTTATP
jgi:hypothetical protein